MSEREAWLEERRKGIGASEVGILFGVSPYGSLLSLYVDKIGESSDSDDMGRRIGRELEQFVVRLTEEETGLSLEPQSESIAMPGFAIARATPDAWVFQEGRDRGVMDAKVVGQHKAREWSDGGLPLLYQLQLQQQMMVTGCTWGIIAGLMIGANSGLVCYELDADPELHEVIKSRIEWFWKGFVEPKIPPDADGSSMSERAIADLHPSDNGMMIKLGKEFELVKNELVDAQRDLDDAKKRVALRKNQLSLAIGDATFCEFPDGTGASLKTQRHASGSTFRVLRIMRPSGVRAAREICDAEIRKMLGSR